MRIKRISEATSHLFCTYLSFWWNSIIVRIHAPLHCTFMSVQNLHIWQLKIYVTDFQGIIMECNLTLWYCWMLLNRNLKFLNFKTFQCCCKVLRNSFWKVRLGRRTLEVFMKSVIADKTIILSQIQNQNPGSLYCWVSY